MSDYEEEIDLRPYILLLIRSWWKIALLVLFAIGITILVSMRQPREYEATASILITRTRPSLALAQEFPTIMEPVDSNSRMNALLSISRSDSLAIQSINMMKDDLPLELQNIEDFKKLVSVSNSGDVILISATATDPELAANIANAWAQQAVLSINTAYSGEQLPSRIQAQLVEALNEYNTAQAELEFFLTSSQESLLMRLLSESETLLNSLTNTRTWQIAYFAQRLQNMDQIIIQAEALKQQFEGGSASTAAGVGDAIAVLQVRANAFGVGLSPVNLSSNISGETSGNNPVINITTENSTRENLSLNLPVSELSTLTENQDNYEQDIDRLISLAQEEKSKAEGILEELSDGVLQNQQDDWMLQVANQVQYLSAQLENERSTLKELTSHRDLTWRAYQVLAEKETELRNATQTSNQVSLATLAVPPQEPSPRGLLMRTAIAFIVSLLLGSIIVLGSYWWQSSILTSRSEKSTPAVNLK